MSIAVAVVAEYVGDVHCFAMPLRFVPSALVKISSLEMSWSLVSLFASWLYTVSGLGGCW